MVEEPSVKTTVVEELAGVGELDVVGGTSTIELVEVKLEVLVVEAVVTEVEVVGVIMRLEVLVVEEVVSEVDAVDVTMMFEVLVVEDDVSGYDVVGMTKMLEVLAVEEVVIEVEVVGRMAVDDEVLETVRDKTDRVVVVNNVVVEVL
jgi:hypothetical protein